MLQIRLLGKVDITVSGAPLSLRGKSGLWLLGILTLHANRAVERDWLAGILWSESAPEQGRANLRRALTDVRHALGDAAVLLSSPTPQTISFQVAENEADVLAFRAGAIERYGGELMPGCTLDWVEAERRLLEESYLNLGEKRATALPPDTALVLLEQLRTTEPLRESLLRLHLSTLCQQGNRAEAQQVYHRFRRLLLEQRLGEPSAQTQRHWEALQTVPAPAVMTESVAPTAKLPVPLTPCLGRRNELETIKRLLQQHRLVTLTGLGGIGKTRLSIEIAHETRQALFVELAEWRDTTPLTKMLETLLAPYSGGESLLLVLDNFEQLVGPEANRAVRTLLENHSHVRCLITSRRALGLSGEHLFTVEPLELPQFPGSPARLGEFASIQLLVERARALNAKFELTPANAPVLVELCQQTEGIPLALELLAAHLRCVPPEALLPQIKKARLPVLARRTAGETPRHQSLWRIVESSVAFLSESERTGFWQLAAFRGGWTLEAAQAVYASDDPFAVVTLLETLTDNSLIRFNSERYSQLETLREYSLATQTETIYAAAKHAHADYYLAFAEKVGNDPGMLGLMDAERDNLQAAFETLLEAGDIAAAMRWARALRRYWFYRWGGHIPCERLLTLVEKPSEQAELWDTLGVIHAMNGDVEKARKYFNDSLAYRRDIGDTKNEAKTLSNLAGTYIDQGDFGQARAYLEQALPLWRTLDQSQGLGATLGNLSIAVLNQGDLETAERLIEEALVLRSRLGDTYGIGTTLINRGSVELRRGESSKAEATYREALELFQKLSDRRGEVTALEGLVEVFLNQDRPEDALRFFQETRWLRQEYKLPETALQKELYDRIRQLLGEGVMTPLVPTQ